MKQKTGMCLSCTSTPPLCRRFATSWCPRMLFAPFAQKPLPAAEQLTFEIAGAFVCEPKHCPCQNVWFMRTIRNLNLNLKGSILFEDEVFSAWIPQPDNWKRIPWALHTESIGHTGFRLELQLQLKKWLGKEGGSWIVTYEMLKQKTRLRPWQTF